MNLSWIFASFGWAEFFGTCICINLNFLIINNPYNYNVLFILYELPNIVIDVQNAVVIPPVWVSLNGSQICSFSNVHISILNHTRTTVVDEDYPICDVFLLFNIVHIFRPFFELFFILGTAALELFMVT